MAAHLNDAQQSTVRQRLDELGPGAGYVADRDEPHDEHVFVCLYGPDGKFVEEIVLEGDGTPAG